MIKSWLLGFLCVIAAWGLALLFVALVIRILE